MDCTVVDYQRTASCIVVLANPLKYVWLQVYSYGIRSLLSLASQPTSGSSRHAHAWVINIYSFFYYLRTVPRFHRRFTERSPIQYSVAFFHPDNQSRPPSFTTFINSASGVPSSSPRSVQYSQRAVSGSDINTDSIRTPGVCKPNLVPL